MARPDAGSAPAATGAAAGLSLATGASERAGGRWAGVWRELKRNRLAIAGLYIVLLLFAVAAGADFLANNKPYYMVYQGRTYFPVFRSGLVRFGLAQWQPELLNVDFKTIAAARIVFPPVPYLASDIDLTAPFEEPSARHWLGTDKLGRDVMAGLVHGSRISLSIGFVAVGIALMVGVVLGALAGYFGSWIDLIVSRIFEIMLTLPTLFLLIAIAAMFPPSIFLTMAIIGLTGWVGIARFTRGEFLKIRNLDYVTAALALGVTARKIMFRHILPNALAPVLVSVVLGIAGAILIESSLSFLGIGVPADTVTWGSILNEARSNTFAWWLALFPGAAIFITVLSYYLVGEGLRDALDPRLRGSK
ncbi:MAG TPA: ABC transporter permease [Candidatus Binatia bacterium]|jgi:peptide/nickel transport system permease protein